LESALKKSPFHKVTKKTKLPIKSSSLTHRKQSKRLHTHTKSHEMKNFIVVSASALSLLLLPSHYGSWAQASMPASFCEYMFEFSKTETGTELVCDWAREGEDDPIHWIDYGCGEEGGKNVSIASNVLCSGYIDRLEDADRLWTCAAFQNGTDFSEFLQEVEASDITCASGKAPLFTYTSVFHYKNMNICDNTVGYDTAVSASTTSDEFDEYSLGYSFVVLEEAHVGCSSDGQDDGSTISTTPTTPKDSSTTGLGGSDTNNGDGASNSGGSGKTASGGYARTTRMAGFPNYWIIFLFIASANCMVLLL
jgi:hypothetical protein